MKYPPWNLSFGYESLGEFVIGYFHDAKDGNWKAYENRDRGDHGITLETKNEEEVYDEVIKRIKRAIRGCHVAAGMEMVCWRIKR